MILVMKKAAALILVFVFLLLVPSSVSAEDKNSGASGRPSVKSMVRQEIKGDIKDLRAKSCEVRMDNIKKRSESLAERAEKMENNFGALAVRVQEYYTTKLVPAGVSVSNYDALVSDIATKKAAVDIAIAEAKSKTTSFDCTDVSTAKTRVSEYRVAMQKVIAALKEYKTSVKNLIVAVRTAAGKVVKPSPSPES